MNILERGSDNFGGVNKLFIALMAHAGPELQAGLVHEGMLHHFEQVLFTRASCFHELTDVFTSSGTYYKHQISGRLAKIDVQQNSKLKKWEGRELIVLSRDHNGLTQQLGTLDYPFRMQLQRLTGQQISNFNHYAFSIDGLTLPDIFIYEGLLPGEVIPPLPIMQEFHEDDFNETEFY